MLLEVVFINLVYDSYDCYSCFEMYKCFSFVYGELFFASCSQWRQEAEDHAYLDPSFGLRYI